jgi:hypothetical protein
MTRTQEQHAMSLIRRFGGVAIDHILSVLNYQHEDDWPEVMHLLKNQTQPTWFK